MNIEKARPINRYKQKVKAKMMMKKKRNSKQSKSKASTRIAVDNSAINLENANPSEKQKARLLARFETFRDRAEAPKYASELAALLESNNKDLILKIVTEIDRTTLNQLVEETFDTLCFRSVKRNSSAPRSLSGIFLDLAKSQIEETDPMRAKAVFQRNVAQVKKISKQRENAMVKTSQSNIATGNTNMKTKNVFAQLFSDNDDSDDDDDDDSENEMKDKTKSKSKKDTANKADDSDEYESVDEDEVMNE